MKHLLTIESPENGFTFQNSLVPCFGRLENTSNCATIKSQLLLNSSILININPGTKRFHCILELQPGENSFSLSYCCISTTIRIELKERSSDFCVLPLYIICKDYDGTFQAPDYENNNVQSACRRITVGCKMLQAAFASKLYGNKTFVLDERGCVPLTSHLRTEEAYGMNRVELWQNLAREILQSSFGNANTKYIAFLACTKYNSKFVKNNTHEEFTAATKGYVAYGGEAFALLGTSCLFTWPETSFEIMSRINNDTLVDTAKFLDDSFNRGTLAGCFATSLGAALHELCHTFNLGHSEEGIMRYGFNNIQQVFTGHCTNHIAADDAFWTRSELTFLNYHRWFNNHAESKQKYILNYNDINKVVKSTAGIRVIEIRQGIEEKVIHYWIFEGKILKYSFQIDYEKIDRKHVMIIVVEDNCGNILKCPFL